MKVFSTTTLNKDTNIISSDYKIRFQGIGSLKGLIDMNTELGQKYLAE